MPTQSLYIQLFSIHGLLRSESLELGRDADTGGQINYVVELGRHLSRAKEVERVDLFTRLIVDKKVSEDYARPIEKVNKKCMPLAGGIFLCQESVAFMCWFFNDECLCC